MATWRCPIWVVVCLSVSLPTKAKDKKAGSADWDSFSAVFSGSASADEKSKFNKAHHHHHHHKKEDVESPLDTCPGDYRGKGKCAHEGYRICMRLLDGDKPYIFGEPHNATEVDEDVNKDGLDWWEWSTQPQNKSSWMKGILDLGGHHWCTCSLCTSEAVDRFGCDNLDIICNSSDVNFIRHRVKDKNKTYLKSALECLESKCGKDFQKGFPIIGEDCGKLGCAYDAELPVLRHDSPTAMITAASAFMLIFFVGAFFVTRRSSLSIDAHDVVDIESENE